MAKKTTEVTAAAADAAPAKAVIKAPFKELKVGTRYNYTRNWPAPQTGTEHKTKTHTADVSVFTSRGSNGTIKEETVVRLNATGRFYSLKELPADATFTEVEAAAPPAEPPAGQPTE